jgi:hypothetical protein
MSDFRTALAAISPWISDDVLFPALQLALVALVIFSAVRSRLMISGGGFRASVTRGPASMAIFYGAYTALSGVMIALCLGVDMAADHRIFFVVVDLLLIAYLCLGSNWFRNKLVGWANSLTQVENR